MKYLGKRGLLKLACSLGYAKDKALKEFEYAFYRGDEWISMDEIRITLQSGKRLLITQYEYDENKDCMKEVSFVVYYKEFDNFKEIYNKNKKAV